MFQYLIKARKQLIIIITSILFIEIRNLIYEKSGSSFLINFSYQLFCCTWYLEVIFFTVKKWFKKFICFHFINLKLLYKFILKVYSCKFSAKIYSNFLKPITNIKLFKFHCWIKSFLINVFLAFIHQFGKLTNRSISRNKKY